MFTRKIIQILNFHASFNKIRYLCSPSELSFKSKYTVEQENNILEILNKSSEEELLKYDISKGRVKHLQSWKRKNGQFETMSDILEVESVGENILLKFCNSILNKNWKALKEGSKQKQFLTQTLSKNSIEDIGSVSSIHISPIGVSWTKLIRENNEVDGWDYAKIDESLMKMDLSNIYEFAFNIVQLVPNADVYVMESDRQSAPVQAFKQFYKPNLELIAMLVALLNLLKGHATNESISNVVLTNRVFFLKKYTTSRLFKTYVGKEKVTSIDIVQKLLNNDNNLPCSPIKISNQYKDMFMNEVDVQKDLLGYGLLTAVSFMELCVRKNIESMQSLSPARRNNQQ